MIINEKCLDLLENTLAFDQILVILVVTLVNFDRIFVLCPAVIISSVYAHAGNNLTGLAVQFAIYFVNDCYTKLSGMRGVAIL